MKSPWTVHGIAVPDIVDEVVQWDENETGLTQYEVSGHSMYVFSLVPRANNARGRTITRHEFLHATHDNPHAAKDQYALEAGYDAEAVDGVSDAFVHLVYWQAGDAEADADAVKVALEDLKKQVERYALDRQKALAITLRAMATLRLIGSTPDKLKGSRLVLSYLTADQVSALNKVLNAVQQHDRAKALRLFARIVEG